MYGIEKQYFPFNFGSSKKRFYYYAGLFYAKLNKFKLKKIVRNRLR